MLTILKLDRKRSFVFTSTGYHQVANFNWRVVCVTAGRSKHVRARKFETNGRWGEVVAKTRVSRETGNRHFYRQRLKPRVSNVLRRYMYILRPVILQLLSGNFRPAPRESFARTAFRYRRNGFLAEPRRARREKQTGALRAGTAIFNDFKPKLNTKKKRKKVNAIGKV